MLIRFIKSIKKSFRLKKLSTKLVKSKSDEEVLDEFLLFCKTDENVSFVILKYDGYDAKLKKLYYALLSARAGRYIKGHYVAASSFAFAWTLKFLLDHFDGEEFYINDYDNYNSSLFIVHRLIEYFEKNEAGEVKY